MLVYYYEIVWVFLKQVGYLVQAVENPEQKAELPGVQSVGDALRSPSTKQAAVYNWVTVQSLLGIFVNRVISI